MTHSTLSRLTEALEFYANADSYVGIGIFCDKPCGEFAEDFSEVDTEHGKEIRPGSRARNALALLKAEGEGEGWIAVGERLPESHVRCLWQIPSLKFSQIHVGYLNEARKIIFSEFRTHTLDEVTHWMPLPSPPPQQGARG